MRFRAFALCLPVALALLAPRGAQAEPPTGATPVEAGPQERGPSSEAREPGRSAPPAQPATSEPAASQQSEPPVRSPFSAQTPEAPAELTELQARIQALDRIEQLDDSVRRPLDFAKAALERSRGSRAAGDLRSETRTRQLARAAVELADARLRLLRERALFLATQARRNSAASELATASHALALERARALELQRGSAAP